MIGVGLFCAAILWSGSYAQSDNNTCLQFQELPPSPSAANQERTVLEDGLQGWASVPHAFIDATGERGLPIALLRSTVPPLLEGNGTVRSPGELGPFSQRLFNQFGPWWAPMLVVTLIGIVFAIAFAVTGLVFCCCRCCNNCGGSRYQDKSKHEGLIKICLGVVLGILIILILIGAIIALVGNEQVNRNVNNFNQELSSVIGDLREYVNTSVFELDFVFDQSSVALNCSIDFLRSSLNNTAMTVGEDAQGNFTDGIVNTSQSLAAALSTLNQTLLSLQTLQSQVSALNSSLTLLKDNLTNLERGCVADLGPDSATCTEIGKVTDQVQISQGLDVGTQLANLTGLRDNLLTVQGQLDGAVMQINADFMNFTTIADELNSAVNEVVQNLQNVTMEYQENVEMFIFGVLQDILTAFDLAPPGQPPPDGVITDAQEELGTATDLIQSSQRIVYGFVILMCCFVLIVVLVLVGALVCAAVSHRKKALPWSRGRLSHCTAITLLIGVGLMFLFAFLLLILCAAVFFLAAMGQKVCYSAGEDSNYAIFSGFTDQPVWNGNQTLFQFLSEGRLNITASGILVSCSNDAPLFQVFNVQSLLASAPGGFSFETLTNLSELIPSTSELLAELSSNVSLYDENVIPQATTELLEDLERNVSQFNVTDNINSLNQRLTNITVDGLLASLERWNTVLPAAFDGQLSGLEEFVNTTVRDQTEAANMTQEAVVDSLNLLQTQGSIVMASAQASLSTVNRLAAELNGINVTEILTPRIETTRAVLVRFADNYTSYALDTVMNEVGRCRPIFNSYSNVYVQVCESTLVGLNAFWWSLGWCVLFFIPTIVVSVILARYHSRMSGPKGDNGYDGSKNGSFAMDKYYST